MSSLLDRLWANKRKKRIKDDVARSTANAEPAIESGFVQHWNRNRAIAAQNRHTEEVLGNIMPKRRGVLGALATSITALGISSTVAEAQTTVPFTTWAHQVSGVATHGLPGTTVSAISKRPAPSRGFDNAVIINEFYPNRTWSGSAYAAFSAVPFSNVAYGTSNTLDKFYQNAADAIADYPFLSSYGITDGTRNTFEVDWCAWMAAFLYVYFRDNGTGAATFRAQGSYIIRHTIQCSIFSARVIGDGNVNLGTHIRYIGANGTVDSPVNIIWAVTIDELGNPIKQPGAGSVAQGGTNGIGMSIENFYFIGSFGNIHGTLGSESNYVSAVRFSTCLFMEIKNCQFVNCLWDGITNTGPSVYTFIERNVFQGVYRDAIAYNTCLGNFSTTMYIRDNSFVGVGRYAILLNSFGSTGCTAVISDNLFEPATVPSFFTLNPQWYFSGVPAQCCFYANGNSYIRNAYFELGSSEFLLGFLHLVNPSLQEVAFVSTDALQPSIVCSALLSNVSASSCTASGTSLTVGGTLSGQFTAGMGISGSGIPAGTKITGIPGGGGAGVYTLNQSVGTIATPISVSTTTRSAEAIAFTNANGWCDLTDTRNYPAGWRVSPSVGYQQAGLGNCVFKGFGNLYTVGGITVDADCTFNATFINQGLDYAVDTTNSANFSYGPACAIATCNGAVISGSTLTIDSSARGVPFATGQLVVCLQVSAIATSYNAFIVSGGPCTIASLGTGAGGAGTYTLSISPGNIAANGCIFAVTTTNRSLSSIFQTFSGTLVKSLATGPISNASLTSGNSGTIAIGMSYGRMSNILEARSELDPRSDNGVNLKLFNALYLRSGTAAAPDSSVASSYNGYIGLCVNTGAMADLLNTAESTYVDAPLFYGNMKNSSGTPVRYLETGVLTKRKIRYSFSASPGAGNWVLGDMAFNKTTTNGQPLGWAYDGTSWNRFGSIIGPTTVASLPAASTALKGQTAEVTDSTTTVFGATVTGGGTSSVLAHCNGTAWTVMGI